MTAFAGIFLSVTIWKHFLLFFCNIIAIYSHFCLIFSFFSSIKLDTQFLLL
jgi:hypothetical protein